MKAPLDEEQNKESDHKIVAKPTLATAQAELVHLNSSGESLPNTSQNSKKKDPFSLFDQVVQRKNEARTKEQELKLKQMNQRADEITFEILADTVAKDIAQMLKNTIDRNLNQWKEL